MQWVMPTQGVAKNNAEEERVLHVYVRDDQEKLVGHFRAAARLLFLTLGPRWRRGLHHSSKKANLTTELEPERHPPDPGGEARFQYEWKLHVDRYGCGLERK